MKCQEGWEEINWRIIDFSDIQDRIVSEDYHVEKPSWVIEKENHKDNRNSSNNGSRNEGDNGHKKTQDLIFPIAR